MDFDVAAKFFGVRGILTQAIFKAPPSVLDVL